MDWVNHNVSMRIDAKWILGLKKAIKEQNKSVFDHIDTNSLDVWNVSIPIDRDANIEEQVKNLKVLQTKSLLPMKMLSGTFWNVVEES